jgi:hypothetical protein
MTPTKKPLTMSGAFFWFFLLSLKGLETGESTEFLVLAYLASFRSAATSKLKIATVVCQNLTRDAVSV